MEDYRVVVVRDSTRKDKALEDGNVEEIRQAHHQERIARAGAEAAKHRSYPTIRDALMENAESRLQACWAILASTGARGSHDARLVPRRGGTDVEVCCSSLLVEDAESRARGPRHVRSHAKIHAHAYLDESVPKVECNSSYRKEASKKFSLQTAAKRGGVSHVLASLPAALLSREIIEALHSIHSISRLRTQHFEFGPRKKNGGEGV